MRRWSSFINWGDFSNVITDKINAQLQEGLVWCRLEVGQTIRQICCFILFISVENISSIFIFRRGKHKRLQFAEKNLFPCEMSVRQEMPVVSWPVSLWHKIAGFTNMRISELSVMKVAVVTDVSRVCECVTIFSCCRARQWRHHIVARCGPPVTDPRSQIVSTINIQLTQGALSWQLGLFYWL